MSTVNFELSPEESAKLASLVNPDAHQDIKFSYDASMQKQILAFMYNDPECLEFARRLKIKPGYFTTLSGERICDLMLWCADTFGNLPPDELFAQCAKSRFNLDEDKLIPWRAEIKSMRYAAEPQCYEKKALFMVLEDFCKEQSIYHYVLQLTTETTSSRDFLRFKKVEDTIRQFRIPALAGPTNAYATWEEVCAAADAQHEDWLIPNWAEFGCVTLFSSLPKLGKSTILAQLIADIMLARQFFGLVVNPAPVLMVDPENRERTTRRRLEHAFAGAGVGKMNEWFFRMNSFAKPLDIALLRKAINDIKAATGQDRIVVLLDTMRSCYSGAIENENDNSEMSKVIVPLKDLAAETNACIFLIHHNAKGADSYAGGTAILGSVDYYWNWRNDRQNKRGELSCWGRGDFTDPIELVFDADLQRNKLYIAGPVKLESVESDLLAIPLQEPGVTRDHLAEVWGVSTTTAYNRLKALLDAGRISERKPTNRKLGKITFVQAGFSCSTGGADVQES